MAENPADAGAALAGETTSDFDDTDELLGRLFALCSPEQKLRGKTPREVLARLQAGERRQLLAKLSSSLTMGPQAAPNPGALSAPELHEHVGRQIGR